MIKSDNKNIVFLNSAHGGFDGGAVANDGTLEKDINLSISQKLSAFLTFNGFQVIMTRDSDCGTDEGEYPSIASRKKNDMQNRLTLMKENPNAVYISIHLNKFTTSAASGTQVFYAEGMPDSKFLGQSIQDSIVSLLQPENRRIIKSGSSSSFLLKNATVPAVIAECGFLSNTVDLKKLKSDTYQKQLAFSINCGILNFFARKDY